VLLTRVTLLLLCTAPIACAAFDADEAARPDGDAGLPPGATDAAADAGTDASAGGDGGDGTDRCAASDLKGHWTADEGAGAFVGDSSPCENHGTLSDTARWVTPGIVGPAALSFVGTSARVDVGSPTSLALEGPLTVAAWVRIESFADNGRILSRAGSSGYRGWELNLENNGIGRLQVSADGSSSFSVDSAPLPLATTLHLAGVFVPSTELVIYVDGEVSGRVTADVPAQTVGPMPVTLGKRFNCCGFSGVIDDVRVYARALSASEIAALALR
jgi:hypothetical protein